MDVHRSHEGGASARALERSGPITSALKRVVDVVVAACALVLTLPVLIVAAVAIRLDSAGPVFIRHVRVGRDGVPFELYWLRSTIHHTTELTRVGRVLRWSSIDELPQMWNVLRGDMSLVGPQPAIPAETAGVSSVGDAKPLRPVPGLTGTWSEGDDSRHGRDSEPRTDQGEPPECGGSDSRAG